MAMKSRHGVHCRTRWSAGEASRQFATQSLSPWVSKIQRAFAMSVLGVQYRLVIDLGDLLRADPEARWASWQKARAAGVLSPNDVRVAEDWPASDDPTADSIQPPVAGGRAAGGRRGRQLSITGVARAVIR